MKRLHRLYNGASRRFEAMDRRWKLIQEAQRGSSKRMTDWARAHLRWAHAAERLELKLEGGVCRRGSVAVLPWNIRDEQRAYEPPKLTLVGNLLEQLGKVH